jgi:S-(hydroxymethyl)glutathione dehydrogenase/alcohol dehydrogenase
VRAAVLNRFDGHFDIEDIAIDSPRGRELLVRVKAAGLCHSDLHMADTSFGTALPAVFGHELAGIVKALGPHAKEFAIGDHVVGSLIQFCGHCRACVDGRTYQCLTPQPTSRGIDEEPRLTRNGQPVTPVFGTAAFAEYALVHENQLVRIPSSMPFAQASLLGCGVITGAGAAVNTAKVRPGDSVAVIGVGGVGLNVISGAHIAGAEQIIAIDIQSAKLDLARKFGATEGLNAAAGDIVAMVREHSNGGVDHAFEVIGLEVSSRQAIRMLRKGGGAYLIGVHKPGGSLQIDPLNDLLRNQVTIHSVFMGSSNIKRDIPMYARLYLVGKLNLDDLISREIKLDEINDAYAELRLGAVARCVITSF